MFFVQGVVGFVTCSFVAAHVSVDEVLGRLESFSETCCHENFANVRKLQKLLPNKGFAISDAQTSSEDEHVVLVTKIKEGLRKQT